MWRTTLRADQLARLPRFRGDPERRGLAIGSRGGTAADRRATEAEHATSSSGRAGLRRGFGEEQKREAHRARAGKVVARAASINCKHRKRAALLSACDLLAKAAKRGGCSLLVLREPSNHGDLMGQQILRDPLATSMKPSNLYRHKPRRASPNWTRRYADVPLCAPLSSGSFFCVFLSRPVLMRFICFKKGPRVFFRTLGAAGSSVALGATVTERRRRRRWVRRRARVCRRR